MGQSVSERIQTAPPSEKMFSGNNEWSLLAWPSRSIQQFVTRKAGNANADAAHASRILRQQRGVAVTTKAKAKPKNEANTVDAVATSKLFASNVQFSAALMRGRAPCADHSRLLCR